MILDIEIKEMKDLQNEVILNDNFKLLRVDIIQDIINQLEEYIK